MKGGELTDFLDQCQIQLSELHDEIRKTYFEFKPRRKAGSVATKAAPRRASGAAGKR
jgi:hypothetical protein